MLEDVVDNQKRLTEALNIRGWSHLDAVILAALVNEAPLLLVGPHGTAKSLLVERFSKALGLEMRHYNAALINYDDLVGIPMPDESGTQLEFITTPGTIWDAGFVFFDEISRCRADLQNKLFPIIHEKRVIGIALENLKFRWAAMNPPAPDDPGNTNNANSYYLGSEPLDPALIDRFPFIIMVPSWADLSKEDRYKLVSWRRGEDESIEAIDLTQMVEDCIARIPAVEDELSAWLPDYILAMMDLLEHNQLSQSPRRARMLAQSIVGVHAARLILGDNDDPEISPARSAEIAMLYGLPQTATEVPPSEVKVVAMHRQVWELIQVMGDENWRQVMEEQDIARRVALADQLGFSDEDMSRLVTQTLSIEDSDARQWGLATAMFLAFRNTRDLDPSAFEPLAQLAYHVLEPRMTFTTLANNSPDQALWNQINQWIDQQNGREDSLTFRLERNYVLGGFPQLWRNHNWQQALDQFKHDLMLFGIDDGENDDEA